MENNMSLKWELVGDYSVEIWFRIVKDAHGYPESKAWEQLLARPVLTRDDYFQIESIPFYLRNISLGDIIMAKTVEDNELSKDEIFEFVNVVDRGGHNTYRLLLRQKHIHDPEFTTNELIGRGLGVEEQYGDFFAVDVPPTIDQCIIDDYLRNERQKGRWEMQDGSLTLLVLNHRQTRP